MSQWVPREQQLLGGGFLSAVALEVALVFSRRPELPRGAGSDVVGSASVRGAALQLSPGDVGKLLVLRAPTSK